VLVPFANLVLLTIVLCWLREKYSLTDKNLLIPAACAVVLGAIGLFQKTDDYLYKDDFQHIRWIAQEDTPNQTYMTELADKDFRLATGKRQYISHKSHPYQDFEVLEWQRRVSIVRQIYRKRGDFCGTLAAEVSAASVSRLIWPKRLGEPIECGFLELKYEDELVTIFEVQA